MIPFYFQLYQFCFVYFVVLLLQLVVVVPLVGNSLVKALEKNLKMEKPAKRFLFRALMAGKAFLHILTYHVRAERRIYKLREHAVFLKKNS